MDLLAHNPELKAQMYLISTDTSHLAEAYLPDVNFNAESVIYLNDFNDNLTASNNSSDDLSCIELGDYDLSGSFDLNNQDLNAFDLSDANLFSFINEIDFLTCDSMTSPAESVCTCCNFDSFSSSSSPITSESDQDIQMVKSKRKVDKKESNKAAASRYRSKKSKEKDQLFAECNLYEEKNNQLKEKISDLETEINSIKNLLVQALLIKENVLTNKNILASSSTLSAAQM